MAWTLFYKKYHFASLYSHVCIESKLIKVFIRLIDIVKYDLIISKNISIDQLIDNWSQHYIYSMCVLRDLAEWEFIHA